MREGIYQIQVTGSVSSKLKAKMEIILSVKAASTLADILSSGIVLPQVTIKAQPNSNTPTMFKSSDFKSYTTLPYSFYKQDPTLDFVAFSSAS